MEHNHGMMRLLLLLSGIIAFTNAGAAENHQEGQVDYFEPGIVLPDGEGRVLILRACTRCHTLEGVPAYSKYWGFQRWLPMVENMIEHGAKLDENEKNTVARYLGKYFGIDE